MVKLPISRIKNLLEEYEAVGGNLALDFANTLGGNRSGKTKEYLNTYADLISWAKKLGLLNGPTANKYLSKAAQFPDLASGCLERAKELREAIYKIVTAPMYERNITEDLFLISKEATMALGHARIVPVSNGFSWQWSESELNLDRVLWPIARSISDLVTSPNLQRVRECASETCTWVFLDTSKNHTRRWCVMKDCGNREKVRRHRTRVGQ
jgi:predicted RNA-binding Zn ribbon-like protein